MDLLLSILLQITDLAQKMAKTLCEAEKDNGFLENLIDRQMMRKKIIFFNADMRYSGKKINLGKD